MPLVKVSITTATPKQLAYIEQLLIDCYCSERVKRNAQLSFILDRPIKYLDEIRPFEAGIVIDYLKDLKQRIKDKENQS